MRYRAPTYDALETAKDEELVRECLVAMLVVGGIDRVARRWLYKALADSSAA